jgi:hypothetical protein
MLPFDSGHSGRLRTSGVGQAFLPVRLERHCRGKEQSIFHITFFISHFSLKAKRERRHGCASMANEHYEIRNGKSNFVLVGYLVQKESGRSVGQAFLPVRLERHCRG